MNPSWSPLLKSPSALAAFSMSKKVLDFREFHLELERLMPVVWEAAFLKNINSKTAEISPQGVTMTNTHLLIDRRVLVGVVGWHCLFPG